MLAWPSFALLKTQYPDSKITALVPQYTAPLAEQCAWIDEILIDKKEPSLSNDIFRLARNIRINNFDASVSLFSESRTAIALFLSGVKLRVGPATKLAQIFLNETLRQNRSRSIKPEYEYNLDLIKHYITYNKDIPVNTPKPPYLSFDGVEISRIKTQTLEEHSIPENRKLLIIHPGTGGSAINLTLEQYAELAACIVSKTDVHFIITAGPDELMTAQKLSALMPEIDHHVYHSNSGIIDFCKFIGICDVFISGSTGPLHIAGALNKNTAAFYPARKSATRLRWQTLNSDDKRISFSPEKYTGINDMQQINMNEAAGQIISKFIL